MLGSGLSFGTIAYGLGFTALLVLTNGLFVAAEYAFVRVRQSRVQELIDKGDKVAGVVQILQKDMGVTIAGTQLGITLASLALGWIGENSVQAAVKSVLGLIPGLAGIQPPAGLAFGLAFVILSLFHVGVGEQVAKSWALSLPENTALALAKPISLFCKVTHPLLWVVNSLARLVLRCLRLPETTAGELAVHSADEFELLFDASRKAGELDQSSTDLLKRALELKDLTARQVMIHRLAMDCIPDNLSLAEILDVASKTKHSRLPVFCDTRDRIVGILNTKDLFDLWVCSLKADGSQAEFRLSEYLREVHFVAEGMPAGKILKEMGANKFQMVIVLDEFGGTAGMITLEDLLEQLVGDIWDEYDVPHPGVKKVCENRWQVKGDLTLVELNNKLGTSVESSCYTTIAGAVIEKLGKLAEAGDALEIEGYRYTVVELDHHAITLLEVEKLNQHVAETQPDGTS